MHEDISPITLFVNHHLGSAALAVLHSVHIRPENADLPIPQHVIMGILVVFLFTILALILKSRLSVEKPGAMQQVAEMLLTNPMGIGIRDILDESGGRHTRSSFPFVGVPVLFLLFS